MSKVSMPLSNDYCPQTLFLYGTRGADGAPDFGLFCWFSYAFDGEMVVMACIGGDKLTKERILENKVFSANLVTESILPLADYMGNTDGHDASKMAVDAVIENGRVLDVPVLTESPLAFELEAYRFIPLDDGVVMLCRVRNVLVDEALADASLSVQEKMNRIRPVHTTCSTYFDWNGKTVGDWGEPMKRVVRKI